MFQKPIVRLTAIIALTVVLTLGIAAVAFSFVPSDLQPKGAMRMAVASASNVINTTSTSFVEVPSLSTNILVPDGKVADVVIEFSGQVNSPDALYVRALVDTTQASPGPVQVFYNTGGGATTQGFNFYRLGVPSGSHRISIQWRGLGGQQYMRYRSMIVLVNIRNP